MRDGWKLYIAAGGVMLRIYPATVYTFHTSLISTILGTYLSRIMFGSPIMAF
jgi:hypothetical protein